MPTSLSRYFSSSSSSPPSPSSYVMHQLNLLPTNSPRLLRQNAFVIDPANPHDPFEAPSRQSISDDTTLSPSDSFSDYSNETNPVTQQQQPIVERIPLPENTADNDRPEPFDPHQHPYSHPLDKILCVIFISLLSIWTFQVISCTNIMHLSTERLSVVDPGGPSYVYIPVFQWTCWRQTWVGMHHTSIVWIISVTMALYWLRGLKRR